MLLDHYQRHSYNRANMARFTFVFVLVYILVCSCLIEAKGPQHGKLVVCYMASWGVYLPGRGLFDVKDTEPALPYCTHLVYLFVGLDSGTNKIKTLDARRDLADDNGLGGIPQSVAMKKKFPHLKVMVCIGGWNEGSINYSQMVSTKEKRKIFIQSVVEFLRKHGLDGIEVNWQYPGDRGGSPNDKQNIVHLMKEMKQVMSPLGLLHSVTVSGFPYRIKLGINIAELSKHASWVSVLTYEYHGFWERRVGVSTPLTASDENNIEHAMNLLRKDGARMNKLLLGISNYGMTFFLNDATTELNDVIGASAKDFGFRGPIHGTDGFIGYNEICSYEKEGWKKGWHAPSTTPFLVLNDRVVSYDDEKSIAEKIRYAAEEELAGVIYYSLEKDDFHGECSKNGSYTFPLLKAIDAAFYETTNSVDPELLDLLSHHTADYFWNQKNKA